MSPGGQFSLSRDTQKTVDTRWIATGICLVIVGFVLAKGFVSSQQVRLPLLHLSEVPGLDFLKGLRATQRFSLLLYFGIMILSGAGAATLAARCRSARSAWIAISLACLVFLAEVYPIRLPFEPRPYEISRLDVEIPRLWRDETRAPVVVHLPIHYFLRRLRHARGCLYARFHAPLGARGERIQRSRAARIQDERWKR